VNQGKMAVKVLAILGIPVLVLALFFHNSPWLFTLGTIELALVAAVVNAFVAIYSRRRWRANAYGRALMYSMASLAIVADLSMFTILMGPDWTYRSVVRLVIYGAILIAQLRMFQLLFAKQTDTTTDEYRHQKPTDND
jgi:Ca2+/H+ antiporter